MKTSLLFLAIFISSHTKNQTLFIWPVQPMSSYGEVPGFYSTNNFVDQFVMAGMQDWNCGLRTYGQHRGIDIDLWPFTWSMMDNNHVAVVAAAPGRVVSVRDNLTNENNCAQPGENTNWNFIAIRHADSSTSIYGHIRTNSAQVVVGQFVSVGEIIAFVGSSGSSSNPHLHFEVNSTPVLDSDPAGLIDPYAGPCSQINTNSWWQNQKSYWEPAVLRVMTHSGVPSLMGYDLNPDPGFCRSAEVKNDKAAFAPNEPLYVGVAMRDYLQNQSFTLNVYYPNGALWFTDMHINNTSTNHEKRYYIFGRTIPALAPAGTYKAVVNFNGTTAVHFFSVNCPATQNVTGILFGHSGFKASTSIAASSAVSSGNRVLFQAGSQIRLLPGFVAGHGSVMRARIRDCNYSE